tara:strand:+ start:112 stop:303 length:192 start_codon:yes stop_codon:yes gene_type:complete
MKWILLYIIIVGNDIMSVNAMGPGVKFDTIEQCVVRREELAHSIGNADGELPPGREAICIKVE